MKRIQFIVCLFIVSVISLAFLKSVEASEYNRYVNGRLTERFVVTNGQLYKLNYHYDQNGNRVKQIKTEVASNLYSPEKTSYTNGAYEIVIAGIDLTETNVFFPTWTEYNGQDDLIWYPGENLGSGLWKARISFNQHDNERGKYITHIYIGNTMYSSKEIMVQDTTNIQIPLEVNLAEGSYDVYISGVGAEAEVVRFPTWTAENGQDDTKWYEGHKISEDTWKTTIWFKEHQQQKGLYITHIYSYDRFGNPTGAGGGSTVAVKGVHAPVEVSKSNASYEIITAGIDPGIKAVAFPTWTLNNEQDDLIWYQGVEVDTGVWKAVIPFANHNSESGHYITHIYNEYNELMGDTTTLVKDTTHVVMPAQVNLADGSYDIIIEGVGEQAAVVRFPTWTDQNGQDDIEWKEGYKIADGTWKVTIQFGDHNHETGSYITHIYSFDKDGNTVFIGGGVAVVN